MFGRKGKQSLELDAGDIGKQGGSTPQKDVESVSGGMDTKQDGDDINIDLSGARRRSRRASASDVLVPRWLHIMHYVVHAVFLLLLILLIIAIAMVETDAKDDGEDGVVNSILKAFKLQVDGAVSQGGFDCSSADDTLDSSTQQMMLDKAESFQMIFEDPSKYSLDELDKYLSPDAVILLTSGAYTVTTLKDLLVKWNYNATMISDDPDESVVINKIISGSRVLLKADRYDSTNKSLMNSKFVSFDFDTATGKIVRLASYPSLDIESERMAAVKLIMDISLTYESVDKLDTIRFTDDFQASFRGGILNYDALKLALGSGMSYYIPPEMITTEYFVSGYKIVLRQEIRVAPESDVAAYVGFIEFVFTKDGLQRMLYTDSQASSMLGKLANQWNSVWDTNDYDLWDSLVTDDYVYHGNNGNIYTLQEFKDFIRKSESSRSKQPVTRKLASIVTDPNVIYSFWVRTVDADTDNPTTRSGAVIQTFDLETGLIKYTYDFSTTDITAMVKAVDAFQGMRNYALNIVDDPAEGAALLAAFDNVQVTDDFLIDSFWGGYENYTEFRDSSIRQRQRLAAIGDASRFTNLEYRTITQMISDHIFFTQAMWVPKDRDTSQFSNVSSSTTPRTQISAFTNAEILYFDPASAVTKPVLQQAYFYNSTLAMAGMGP